MKYQDKTAFDTANHFGKGQTNDAYAKYFIGQSYLKHTKISSEEISDGRILHYFLC